MTTRKRLPVLFAVFAAICAMGAFAEGKKIKVACIGDSITWGYAMTNRIEECYPARLQEMLGPGYEVGNFGDPGAGAYTRQFKDKSYRLRDTYGSAVAFGADIVVCNLGINDQMGYQDEYIHDGTGNFRIAPGTFRQDYIDLLESFAKGGNRPRYIIWTKLAPLDTRHRNRSSLGPFVMERDLEAVAKAVGAESMDVFTPLRKYMNGPHFVADGVHPEGEAQREIARLTAEQIWKVPSVVCAMKADEGTEELTGPDLWAQRASHPAVVNPVLGQDAANVISLRGEWEFMTRDEFGRNRPGPVCDWMWEAKPWPRKISVPGCWEAQGVGEPGMSVCWNITTDHNAKPIRHRHMGVGCYRRKVDVPVAWRGKRIWLKVGGAKSVGWFHVNGKHVACVDNFCGTYKYEITDLVVPGEKATIVAQVRNDVPSRKGLLSAMHRWGGLYRDVELEATPSVFIDDAWVRGDFDGQTAEMKVKVEGLREVKVKGEGEQRNVSLCLRATVEGETREISIHSSPSPSDFTLKVPLPNFRPWSPEHPNLYTGLVELVENGRVIHARRERFGVRKLEVRGKEFYLNGRPYFFRGFGDDHVYPITGITPADVDAHRRHLAIARKAGFNVVRLHSHTEVPEYFEAADELGILIEAELPYYNNEPPEGQSFDPKRDVTELWRHYRRYPSFGVYSMGNEGSFGEKLDRAMHRYVKTMDPDRLKINQDSSFAGINPPESADYTGGPIQEWPRGSFNPDRPFVNHEYLNLGAKLDSRLEPKFTGVWQPPVTRAARKAWLETFGLDLAWGDRLQDASHALQAVYQKRGIESLRCDPYSDGYHFWTIADVVVSNLCTYSAQGLLTPFWEPKSRGLSPEDFAVFNSPSCVLLDKALGNMVFTAGEAFSSDVLLAHYGDEALADARLGWTLAAEGRSLGAGSVPVGNQAIGAVRKIAEVSFKMPSVDRPVKATITLALTSQPTQTISNSWSCWIFPVREKKDGRRIAVADPYREKLKRRYGSLLPAARVAEADVVIAPFGSRLVDEALKRGQRVIALDGLDGKPNVSMGWWFMGSQVGTSLLDHPVFGELPHEGVLSPLLFRILKTGRKLPFPGLSAKDLLAVGEGGDACYLYLAQAKCGKGRLLLSFGLDVLSDTPEGAVLLDGFVDYVLSDGFNPEGEVALTSSEGR